MIISLPDDPKPWRLLHLAAATGYVPKDPHMQVNEKNYPIGPCAAATNWEFYCHMKANGPAIAPTSDELVEMIAHPELLEMRNMMGMFGG